MATELYDILVPQLVRGLTNLAAILAKGEAHATEHGIAEDDLLATRLTDDMAPLTRQVQMASDSAKGAVARLGGVAIPAMPDEEVTIADLQARIAKTLDFIATVPRDAIDGKEASEIVLTFPNGEFRMTGLQYATAFVLPNFYFHVTTAYALLRHRGADIGKRDYLGGL